MSDRLPLAYVQPVGAAPLPRVRGFSEVNASGNECNDDAVLERWRVADVYVAPWFDNPEDEESCW
jgi:hypothetical protein